MVINDNLNYVNLLNSLDISVIINVLLQFYGAQMTTTKIYLDKNIFQK